MWTDNGVQDLLRIFTEFKLKQGQKKKVKKLQDLCRMIDPSSVSLNQTHFLKLSCVVKHVYQGK